MKMTEMQDRRFGWVFRRTWGQDFRRTCVWTLGLVAVFVFLGCFTDVEAQSLGDVARKSRKEKKKKKTPSGSRVFTNEEISTLPPLTGTSTTSSGSSSSNPPSTSSTGGIQGVPVPAATAAQPQVAGVSNKPDTSSEEYWRNRFGQARYRLERSERELAVLKDRMQISQVQYSSNPNQTLQQEYSRGNVNSLNEQVQKKEADVAKYQQEIRQLEQELRRAGGPIGWSRTPARAPLAAFAASPSQQKAPKEKEPDDPAQKEQYWKGRFRSARAELAEAEQDFSLQDGELSLATSAAAREPDTRQRQSRMAGLAGKRAEVERYRRRREEARAELEDLQREFSASGAPRAWAEP
ncbi:MAG: hypothetical protein O6850_03550 [Acidobacteria bacterium]|nr:hypothetical protein [Acidobacteriota bacterium]